MANVSEFIDWQRDESKSIKVPSLERNFEIGVNRKQESIATIKKYWLFAHSLPHCARFRLHAPKTRTFRCESLVWMVWIDSNWNRRFILWTTMWDIFTPQYGDVFWYWIYSYNSQTHNPCKSQVNPISIQMSGSRGGAEIGLRSWFNDFNGHNLSSHKNCPPVIRRCSWMDLNFPILSHIPISNTAEKVESNWLGNLKLRTCTSPAVTRLRRHSTSSSRTYQLRGKWMSMSWP